MTTARLAVVALCLLIALGSLGIGFASAGSDDEPASQLSAIDVRKDDGQGDQVVQAEPDPDDEPTGDGDDTPGDDGTGGGDNTGDGDRTRGNDGTSGGENTGDGDRTRGNDGTSGGNNTGDGDWTGGNDGTGGGDNSYVAPAPAPVYGGGDGGSASGGT